MLKNEYCQFILWDLPTNELMVIFPNVELSLKYVTDNRMQCGYILMKTYIFLDLICIALAIRYLNLVNSKYCECFQIFLCPPW